MSYVTEAQARENWCPMVRYEGDTGGTFNRGIALDDVVNSVGDSTTYRCCCIGQRCMSWRWFGYAADDAYAEAVRKAAEEIGDKSSSRAQAAKHVNANREKYGLSTERLGYCGLAGQPSR